MATIKIYKSNVDYDKSTKTFSVSGNEVPQFGTKHILENEKTGNVAEFDFSHSTGSEWDVDTKWIYKSLSGFLLEIGNEDVTPQHAQNYLNAKLR